MITNYSMNLFGKNGNEKPYKNVCLGKLGYLFNHVWISVNLWNTVSMSAFSASWLLPGLECYKNTTFPGAGQCFHL